MYSIAIDPVYLEIGGPALLIGLLLGALVTWLVQRRRRRSLLEDIGQLETRIKDQDALQAEREAAFEAANAKLAAAFSDLANQSLKSNSETFLRLAEQNLGAQQEKAKRDLGERDLAGDGYYEELGETA